MVTSTHDKLIWRVEFDMPFTIEKDRTDGAIVCFLRASDQGLDIFYSHHVFRSRPITAGPYQQESYSRLPLTDALRSWIDHAVMLEFWSTVTRRIETSPAPPDQYANLIDFDGRPVKAPFTGREV